MLTETVDVESPGLIQSAWGFSTIGKLTRINLDRNGCLLLKLGVQMLKCPDSVDP
jgi:hypothetical protein